MMRFQNKVALVTGGGRGIGRATVLRFAQEGASVVIADLNLEWATGVAEEVGALGQQALPLEVDVRAAAACEKMIEDAMAHFGQLDVVFANAGVGGGAPVEAMDDGAWNRVMDVNLHGVFFTCRAAIPALRQSKGGAIVTMASSMAGWDVSNGGSAYMASKAGVAALTKGLALEVGRYNIRVNAVCPGIIQTHLSFDSGKSSLEEWQARYDRFAERIPLRRVGQPEDVAATVAFLASDDARHISGSLLLIDGGQTLQSWSNAPEGAYPWEG